MSTHSENVVQRIREAPTDDEARRIELSHLIETDKQPEDPGVDDGDG